MLKCEICGREFKDLCCISKHIAIFHKLKIVDYYLKYINPEKGKCVECGKNTTFKNLRDGYCKFCSSKCTNLNLEIREKFKEKCMKKYGVDNPSKCDDFDKKAKKTFIKRYGCENPSQCKEIQNKKIETCMKNFGVEYPSQNDIVKQKRKETWIEKYGVDNPNKCIRIRNKSKETCYKNHGCEYPIQNQKIRDKSKITWLKNFGSEHPSKCEEIQNKKKENCVKKYGCEYPSQCEEISKKIKLNFEKIQKRYPDLVICEELISGPNGEILGHCKNSSCKNSKENGGYFELNVQQIWNRNFGINSVKDGDYIYCSEECKKECILFGKNASQLHNLVSEDHEINFTLQEYSTWKNEILSRQLKDNPEHSENFCEICHSIENLQCHHIQPQKLEPGYALDPPNGMILCQKCHFEKGHEKGTECSTGNLANKLCK